MTQDTLASPCGLCALQRQMAQGIALATFQALGSAYARAQCACRTHAHRLLLQHPHVPAGCTGGFAIYTPPEDRP